jgi:hypothetical protein
MSVCAQAQYVTRARTFYYLADFTRCHPARPVAKFALMHNAAF